MVRRASKQARMARRRKRRTLKPRVPKRVKVRKKRERKTRGQHQHPELVGLGLVALGVFLGAVLRAGWNGGYVGGWIADGLDSLIGSASLGLPAALAIVGSRSEERRVGKERGT